MCGIFAFISNYKNTEFDFEEMKNEIYELLSSRGPDSNGYYLDNLDVDKTLFLAHTRLQINGDDTCQPLIRNDKILIINGEIFNWKELEIELGYNCKSSDCEIIFPLYDKYQNDLKTFFKKLNGQYSFFMYDKTNDHFFVGRDHIGVTPLYMSYNKENKSQNLMFSSEMKCLEKYANDDTVISIFPPRSYIYSKLTDIVPEIKEYLEYEMIKCTSDTYSNIKQNVNNYLIGSVWSQLQDLIIGKNKVDFGVLLSGGLDSSLIASIVVKLCKQHGFDKSVKTFSIGVDKNAPDLIAARRVAEYLGTEHYEFYFSIDDGIKNIERLIWSIESYDCTTIRASTPMYFLAQSIKKTFPQLKVILSGELSDELLCYLYGANAPSESDFQLETIKLVNNVHLFDCLRANKTCMAHSLEVRVPFADKHYVEYILSLPPSIKMFGSINGKIEKQILRESFTENYLPDDILWRKKEQFSDGVSGFDKHNNWIDSIKEYTNNYYTDNEFEILKKKYICNTPDTKEKLYYRQIFSNLFKHTSCDKVVKEWLPNWSDNNDPSGRIQNFWKKD